VRKFFRSAGGGSVLTGSGGEGGPEGWTSCGGGAGEREGEGEGGGPWHGVEQRDGVALARQWRTAGSARRESTWLTGGPGRYGGPVVSSWVWHGAVR
jgi:hypothetical protein